MGFLPGLPALPAGLASLFQLIPLLTADGFTLGATAQTQWGIFLNGQPVVLADTVVSVEFRQDFRISTYPQEKGAFRSYNKVQTPFDVRVSFARGGSVSDRAELLSSIAAIIGDTNLYDVVTPEVTLSNLNLVHQDYNRKSSQGLGLMVVDVWAEEVRSATLTTSSLASTAEGTTAPANSTRHVEGVVTFRNAQNPAATPEVNGGNVQPQTPSAADNAAFSSALTAQGNPFND